MTTEPESFFAAMMEKFQSKIDGKEYVEKPWEWYDRSFLYKRLSQEIEEFYEESVEGQNWTKDTTDELLDIANFCMFLWLKVSADEA